MSGVLELRNVSKQFATHLAVDDISLSIEKGSFYALLGPSGCGKTTTLRLIAGFEHPSSGEILLNGSRVEHLKPYERPVSTVFQSYALFPHLTVLGNIEFGLRRKRTSTDEMNRQVTEVIELLQLGGKEDRKPAELSGGEKQRVALARSLVLRPDVLLLDEPLSALDPNLRKQVRTELKAIQRSVGTTFVFVTHDQEEALSLSDCIAVLHQGGLQQTGTPEELYTRPRTKFVAGFLGAVNWVEGIGVRPELTRISRTAPSNGVRAVTGVVEHSTFLGNCRHIHTRTQSGDVITAEVPQHDGNYRSGETVHLWWRQQDEFSALRD